MPLVTKSLVRQGELLAPAKIDGIVNALIGQLCGLAYAAMGPVALTARNLVASDFPGDSNNDWLEVSLTVDNAYANSANGDGTAIADETFIGIYGFKQILHEEVDGEDGADTPAMTTIRITVGGTLVAQWDMHSTFVGMAESGAPATTMGPTVKHMTAIIESPVIITQNQTLTVAFYEVENTLDTIVAFLGIVVEKVGRTLNP